MTKEIIFIDILDYDGHLTGSEYRKDCMRNNPDNVITSVPELTKLMIRHNKPRIDHTIRLALEANATEILLVIGSNRQDLWIDLRGHLSNNTGSVVFGLLAYQEAVRQLCNIPCRVYPILITDILANRSIGTMFKRIQAYHLLNTYQESKDFTLLKEIQVLLPKKEFEKFHVELDKIEQEPDSKESHIHIDNAQIAINDEKDAFYTTPIYQSFDSTKIWLLYILIQRTIATTLTSHPNAQFITHFGDDLHEIINNVHEFFNQLHPEHLPSNNIFILSQYAQESKNKTITLYNTENVRGKGMVDFKLTNSTYRTKKKAELFYQFNQSKIKNKGIESLQILEKKLVNHTKSIMTYLSKFTPNVTSSQNENKSRAPRKCSCEYISEKIYSVGRMGFSFYTSIKTTLTTQSQPSASVKTTAKKPAKYRK